MVLGATVGVDRSAPQMLMRSAFGTRSSFLVSVAFSSALYHTYMYITSPALYSAQSSPEQLLQVLFKNLLFEDLISVSFDVHQSDFRLPF